jgi:peptidoglycan/LPS O-acetylase OafA/YrhL
VVQYLSRISYGIYLYHLIVPVFFWKAFGAAQRYFSGYDLSEIGKLAESPFASFWIFMVLAIGCASVSWYCLEQPINQLRKLIFYVIPKKKKTEEKVSGELSEQVNRPV